MTPPVPDEIRKAAHDATDLPLGRYFQTSPYELIDMALDTAAPLFRADERARLREMAEARKGELVLHGLLSEAVPWTILIGLIDDIQAEAGDDVA